MQEFNKSLRLQLEERIPPHVPLYLDHRDSSATRPLQAVDLFAWGIFRKYEVGDTAWYEFFREKIQFERVYQINKKESDPCRARPCDYLPTDGRERHKSSAGLIHSLVEEYSLKI